MDVTAQLTLFTTHSVHSTFLRSQFHHQGTIAHRTRCTLAPALRLPFARTPCARTTAVRARARTPPARALPLALHAPCRCRCLVASRDGMAWAEQLLPYNAVRLRQTSFERRWNTCRRDYLPFYGGFAPNDNVLV